jgi:GPR1/FUN34/yaaH family
MGTITFVMFLCTFVMNMTISLLFFLLMMTFFLLAGGVNNETVDQVAGWFGMATAVTAYWLGSVKLINDVIGGGEDLIPLGSWGANKFLFAGVMHVPGRIHGVTHRRVLMDSDYGPVNDKGRALGRRRRLSLAERDVLKNNASNTGDVPNLSKRSNTKVRLDVEGGASESA